MIESSSCIGGCASRRHQSRRSGAARSGDQEVLDIPDATPFICSKELKVFVMLQNKAVQKVRTIQSALNVNGRPPTTEQNNPKLSETSTVAAGARESWKGYYLINDKRTVKLL
ncbi:hypothetical protein EVAR_21700_1 [Eumeta japonica]|uniref:Uncharacterized protein n=1 Tax=Eumeta variegata TaxID=151549 RepID=A0A4C1W8S5_EUMVA|nr:hypothetical protein EVAR_21700_1 [Eumeta japonica]